MTSVGRGPGRGTPTNITSMTTMRTGQIGTRRPPHPAVAQVAVHTPGIRPRRVTRAGGGAITTGVGWMKGMVGTTIRTDIKAARLPRTTRPGRVGTQTTARTGTRTSVTATDRLPVTADPRPALGLTLVVGEAAEGEGMSLAAITADPRLAPPWMDLENVPPTLMVLPPLLPRSVCMRARGGV